jgi:SAM-dependent methyltransferase
VLEVGCGPGHLSIRLARDHGLEVTGLDLDPAMIARARANTDRAGNRGGPRPSFLVGEVAALAFPDQILRPGRQHPVHAPLGRPGGRPDRDRPRPAPRRPSTHLGPPARRPAPSIRTTPCAHP